MPEQDQGARRLRILVSVATFIYNEARGIFAAGTGHDEHGNELSNVVSEIETIPAELDGYRWAHAAARLLRYVIGVLQLALQEEHEEHTLIEAGQLSNFIDTHLDNMENEI
jgi:hypothetical protein